MHIPLMQCQSSGRFKAIGGTTEFDVIAKSEGFDSENMEEIEKRFTHCRG